MPHDAANIQRIEDALEEFCQSFEAFLKEEKVEKDQPGSSDVHVPVPVDEEPLLRRRNTDNLDAGVLKALTAGENDTLGLFDMQQLVSGMDWELEHSTDDEAMATEVALDNLSDDPDYYHKKRLEADSTDDVLAMKGDDGAEPNGLRVDLGSGQCREPGFLGMDLHPYDYGTVQHDIEMGLPFDNESVQKIRMVDVPLKDPKPLLSEIQRVLTPGGQFVYQGPNDIYNYPEWTEKMALVNHEDNVQKVEGNPSFRQVYTRLAQPDAATADDAEPRIGIAQYDMLPADALLAMDALGYYWSDATSSGRGNRLHGYPSQGALTKTKDLFDDEDPEEMVDKDALTTEGRKHIAEHNFALPAERKYPLQDISHARNALARSSGKPEEAKVRAAVYRKYPSLKPVDKAVDNSSGKRVASIAVKHGDHVLMGKRRDSGKWTFPGGHVDPGEDMHEGALRELKEETGIEADSLHPISNVHKVGGREPIDVQCFKHEVSERPSTSMMRDPDGEVYRWQWVDTSKGIPEHIRQNLHVPEDRNVMLPCLTQKAEEKGTVSSESAKDFWQGFENQTVGGHTSKKSAVFKIDKHKQLVYGVVLEPDEVDAQDDYMDADDIETAAHHYMLNSQVVGKNHETKMDNAVPVESYLMPCDYEYNGQYGPQVVKKGSWVLGVKIMDPQEWQKVLDGEYQGFSVGGIGLRT